MPWGADVRTRWRDLLNSGDLSGQQEVVSSALLRAEHYAADRAFRALSANAAADPGASVPDAPKVSTLLLKPVGDKCNLGCPYCYEEERRRANNNNRLDFRHTVRMLDNLLPFVSKPFNIFVHGGEPLLAGKHYFRKLAEYVRNHPNGANVHFGVQTNGTLIDDAWARLFKTLGFSVGVSLDGPPDIHDTQRTGKHGEATYQDVIRGIQYLQANGIEFGVTAVITEAHAQQEDSAPRLFGHFVERGIRRFDTHPAYSPFGTSRDWNLSPSSYARFMSALFDHWIEHADPGIEIRTFEEFFRAMTGFQAQTCFRSQSCTSIIGAEADGTTTACTRPFAPHYQFGNLLDDPLPNIQASKGFEHFAQDEARGRAHRKDCQWAHLCGHGGCPHERLRGGLQAIDGQHVYCTCDSKDAQVGYPGMFRHFIARVENLFDPTTTAPLAIKSVQPV